MSTLTLRLTKSPVLPPILNKNDRMFLESIRRYIAEETELLGCDGQRNVETIYVIYRNVFDKVIDYVTTYKNILTSIKQEYDILIDLIKQGQKDAFTLQGNLRVLTCEPTTLMSYRKRASRLKDKIQIIEEDSAKILKEIEDKLVSKKAYTVPRTVKGLCVSEEKTTPTVCIPGMTIQASYDLEALGAYHDQLEKKKQELKADIKTKYVTAQIKSDLDQALERAFKERDKAALENTQLKQRYKSKKMIAASIATWAKSDKKKKLSNILYEVMDTEDATEEITEGDQLAAGVFDHDDPDNIEEADYLMDYIQRFNRLFDDGQYEAASVYVSNCPRGVLRNMYTMEKFKAAPVVKGKVPPLMIFFEALISSSSAAIVPASAAMTLEGIKCALQQKRLDLVIHWIIQQRITFSEALGDVLFEYGNIERHNRSKCLALAQIVYRQCDVHRKAALCMCLEGQMCGVMEFIHHCKQFSLDDLLFLLKKCPSDEFIQYLINEWEGKPAVLSIGQAVLSLISADHKEYAFQLLENVNKLEESALENVILNDLVCTLEGWAEIAEECSRNKHVELSDKIRSTLTSQDGVVELSPSDDDVQIMEHVFM